MELMETLLNLEPVAVQDDDESRVASLTTAEKSDIETKNDMTTGDDGPDFSQLNIESQSILNSTTKIINNNTMLIPSTIATPSTTTDINHENEQKLPDLSSLVVNVSVVSVSVESDRPISPVEFLQDKLCDCPYALLKDHAVSTCRFQRAADHMDTFATATVTQMHTHVENLSRTITNQTQNISSSFTSLSPSSQTEASSQGTTTTTTTTTSMQARLLYLRPSWNTAFATTIKVLRTAIYNVPMNIPAIRLITDTAVPTWLPILPASVSCSFTKYPPGEWFYKTIDKDRFPFELTQSANETPESPPSSSSSLSSLGLKRQYKGKFILYFHGGAFCFCNTSTHRSILYGIVEASDAFILAVDYRRPPEHPFPAPLDDCLHAYKVLLEHIDASQIFFAGDSAGGNLAVAVCVAAQKIGLPAPAGAMLISPWVDLEDAGTADSWIRNAIYDYLPATHTKYMAEAYRGDATYKQISPAQFDDSDLVALPPLLIECGECEVLHDQITQFAEKCTQLGISVELHVRPDMVHVVPLFSFTNMTQSTDSFATMSEFMRRLFVSLY